MENTIRTNHLNPRIIMTKMAKFFLRLSVFLQIATGCIHCVSFFVDAPPANETERQLDVLMKTYKLDLGAGFHRTMLQIFNSISACFALMFIFAGVITWFLLSAKADIRITRGITTIQTIVFGIATVIIWCLAFLPPLLCTGLVFLSLLFARLNMKKESANA